MEDYYKGLEIIARTYGFLGSISSHNGPVAIRARADLEDSFLKTISCGAQGIYVSPTEDALIKLDVGFSPERGGFLYNNKRNRQPGIFSFGKIKPLYAPLGEYFSFGEEATKDTLLVKDGQAVACWHPYGEGRILLIGLDLVEEIVRYRQGDPAQVDSVKVKTKYGFDFERPNYLFEKQLASGYYTEPWADNLGFFWATTLSRLTGLPLAEPLPGGAQGLILFTGDDDQAYLEKYDAQLRLLSGIPITYFLLPHTLHTSETLSRMPNSVEFGIHVDALDDPEQYYQICLKQCRQVRELVGQPVRSLRNHGFLHSGYLGHLKAWEDAEVRLDFNYPGADGTALNGSFLPMRVQRPNGSWSKHLSLLTAFGDGMIFALAWEENKAVRRIRKLVKQIEANHPGVVVFNFHPQNIDFTKELHRQVVRITRRPGWIALGCETYIDWIESLEGLSIEYHEEGLSLSATLPTQGLVLSFPRKDGWEKREVSNFKGTLKINV